MDLDGIEITYMPNFIQSVFIDEMVGRILSENLRRSRVKREKHKGDG